MLQLLRSILWQDSARKGIGVSTTLHVGAALLLAGGWLADLDPSARFSGSRQAIVLEASFVDEREAISSVELPAVQIQPGVAWIAERRFVDDLPVAAEWELPAVIGEQPASLTTEMSRAFRGDAATEADVLLDAPLPRAQATPEPQTTLTIPEPAGIDDKQPPTFYDNPPPRYPELAKQRGWEGDVLLRLTIDETGRVVEVTVARSSGHPILDAAAVTAIRLWRAEPARRFGQAIATVEYLPVQFRK